MLSGLESSTGITQAGLDSDWLLTIRCLSHLILRLCLRGLHLFAGAVPAVFVFFSNLNPFLCTLVFRFGEKKTRLFPFEKGRGKNKMKREAVQITQGDFKTPLL